MVDVVPLEARHLPALEELVAAHLRLARFPFDASPRVLRQRVARVLGSDGLFAERRRWMVWAALDHQHLVGAARAYAVDRQSGQAAHQDDQVPADIGWLLFEPDRPAAGAALLESALDWIGEDPEGIQAFELAHGLGWGGGIPTAWPHVEEAITRGGFVCQATSYLMWGADTAGFSGAVHHDAQIALEVTPSGAWQFWAHLDGHRVGELLVKPMDSPVGWQPTWRGGRWIDWVHVEEAHRQRGIAAALFGALAEQARQSGVRRLAAATRYAAAIRLNERLGLASRLALRRYALGNPGRRD